MISLTFLVPQLFDLEDLYGTHLKSLENLLFMTEWYSEASPEIFMRP